MQLQSPPLQAGEMLRSHGLSPGGLLTLGLMPVAPIATAREGLTANERCGLLPCQWYCDHHHNSSGSQRLTVTLIVA